MDCDEFRTLLDEADCSSEVTENIDFNKHLENCDSCKKVWNAQKKGLFLLGAQKMTMPAKQKLINILTDCIRSDKTFLKSQKSAYMKPFVFAFVIAAIIIVFLIYKKAPVDDQKKCLVSFDKIVVTDIRGKAAVRRNGGETMPYKETMVLYAGDSIVFKRENNCTVKLACGRMIDVSADGEAEFASGSMNIRNQWNGKLNFSKGTRVFRVHLPTSTLGIRGTEIHLSIDSSSEKVWLQEGLLEWEIKVLGISGILKNGDGYCFSEGKKTSLTSSPCETKKELGIVESGSDTSVSVSFTEKPEMIVGTFTDTDLNNNSKPVIKIPESNASDSQDTGTSVQTKSAHKTETEIGFTEGY
ncbi:MAG: hypothetical protein HQM10_04235 [Candidatus Riflebacteria bacterium]|nr:hypothetical protein [Candidatus Riflebacteria bacterium]